MKSKLNNNLKSYLLVTLLSGIIAACNSGGSPAKTSTTQQTSGATSKIQKSGTVESFIAILKKSNISLILVPNQDSRVSLIAMTNYYGYRNDPSNLDGYKISFYIDGTYYSRVVLVGGQYHFDPTAGIVMDNADQWENDPTINPLIAPNSSVLNSTFNLEYTPNNYMLSCPNNDNLQAMENSLVAQGRNELATKISKLTCTANYNPNNSYTGNTSIISINISINNIPPTRLYIPLQVDYNGYKTFTIWNSTNGVRADHYGDATSNDPNNDHCPYVDTYSFASNGYDGGHITMPNNGYWQGFCWNYSNQLSIAGWE